LNIQHVTSHPEIAPTRGLYSLATIVPKGDLVFISGQTAGDREGNLVGEGNVAVQTRQVFKNLGNILNGVGASFEDVTEFTIYLVGKESINPFLETRVEVFKSIYPGSKYPCSTLVNVACLGLGKALVEISATAVLTNR